MFLNYLILAFCISIDSFGIGITYGVRNTKIARMAKVILFIISTLITSLSIQVGNFFNEYLSPLFTKWIGSTFLILMGLWIIYQALNHKKEKEVVKTPSPNVYQFMIRFLGITIQIIRNPISSDLDKSKKIDWKEAIYLGICLSIDSIGIGICSSMMGYSSLWFPILVSTFQLAFLSVGRLLGEKIVCVSNIPENIWNVLSGILLVFIGISRFLI